MECMCTSVVCFFVMRMFEKDECKGALSSAQPHIKSQMLFGSNGQGEQVMSSADKLQRI